MKIAGLTYFEGRTQMYLKPDTALLVNKKPFFLPHFSDQIDAHPCIVVKINRMGRHIATKFAYRYYTETALGICFNTRDLNNTSQLDDFTRGIAFDNSMAVGTFFTTANLCAEWYIDQSSIEVKQPIEDISEAIAMVSNYITLRTGDMIAVDLNCQPIRLLPEMVIRVVNNNEELLYCKIK